ncbi:MAG: cyclic nucleotide-binding domain-containing protein [Magnetococcales bacterium]|nr:cyclic nucleotide-binding domain-containing protein [Magnetococcales bacterium]
MDTFETLKKRLGDIPFFCEFTIDEMEHVHNNGFFKIFKPGDYIIREGGVDRTLFVLVSGDVKVTKQSQPESVLATLRPGDIFGEIAFVARQMRTTNVIAITKSLVFQLEEKRFSVLPPEMKVKVQQQAVKLLMSRLEAIKRATGCQVSRGSP